MNVLPNYITQKKKIYIYIYILYILYIYIYIFIFFFLSAESITLRAFWVSKSSKDVFFFLETKEEKKHLPS